MKKFKPSPPPRPPWTGQRLAHAIWQRRTWEGWLGWCVLTPFSLAFSFLTRSRNALYALRCLPVKHVPLHVISVGNLTVGGTGKTPMVLWLAQTLQERGYKVGIVSRGYTGKNSGITVVGTEGISLVTPTEVGDEAVMLARRFPGVVIAGRDRVAAARLAHQHFGLDTVILDDGFQHRRLRRDIDLLLYNTTETNNRWLLPAGPFREPRSAARRADIVIVAKGDRQSLWVRRMVKKGKPVFYGDLVPSVLITSVQHEWSEVPLAALAGKRVLALTAIADPLPFYRSLRQWEAEIAEVLEFPDHHAYTHANWKMISLLGQKFDLIVTTEKDLVKLEQFPFAIGKLLALRVQMEIEDADQCLAVIERRLGKSESSDGAVTSLDARP